MELKDGTEGKRRLVPPSSEVMQGKSSGNVYEPVRPMTQLPGKA